MPDENYREVSIQRGEPPMRIELPDEIGYVEIRTTGIHPPTGYPVIGVDVISKTKITPAADGRIYEPARARDDGIVLIGRPGPELLEREKFEERLSEVFEAHASGEHAFCPDTCPAVKAADVPRETSPSGNYTIDVKAIGKHGLTKIPIGRERLESWKLAGGDPDIGITVQYERGRYTVRRGDAMDALEADVSRGTEQGE
jgi:hypothetical protein